MENQIFVIGEVVELKSGGLKMTVISSDENTTEIIYFNEVEGKIIENIKIPTRALKNVEIKKTTYKLSNS